MINPKLPGAIGAVTLGCKKVKQFSSSFKEPTAIIQRCIDDGLGIIDAQEALIEAGFEEAAEL